MVPKRGSTVQPPTHMLNVISFPLDTPNRDKIKAKIELTMQTQLLDKFPASTFQQGCSLSRNSLTSPTRPKAAAQDCTI